MKFMGIGLGIIMGLLMLGCASTSYTAYDNSGVQIGKGGRLGTVDGMDVWENGTPARKYKVIGLINDVRRRVHEGFAVAFVQKAREVGGDALIWRFSQAEDMGAYRTPVTTTGTYSNGTFDMRTEGGDVVHKVRCFTQVEVIKYVK